MSKVMTVCGPISPEKLGVTLSHEHVLLDLTVAYREPKDPSLRRFVNAPITLENLGVITMNVSISKTNQRLDSVEDAINELRQYKAKGGNSLVEVSTPGIGRDPSGLKTISQTTDVNIIFATGWYIASTHPPIVRQNSIDELIAIMTRELTEGIEKTGIKAGVIKCAYSGRPEAEKVLRAAARAQKMTGAPFTIHPSSNANKDINIIEEEGADFGKLYVSHMDRSVNIEYQRSILDRGVTINYDHFADKHADYASNPGVLPTSDKERAAGVAELCKMGYEKQIMLSNDVCLKTWWTKYGGFGYHFILEYIVPALKKMNVTDKQIEAMLVDNPKRIFAF